MDENPRRAEGDATGAEAVDQEQQSNTPPPNRQSEERANGTARTEIHAHVEMLHRLAQSLCGRGKLIVASYGQNPTTGVNIPPRVLHFEIGEIDAMTDGITQLSRDQHRNVYVPL